MSRQKDNNKEKKKKNGGRLFFRILIIVVLAVFIGGTAYSVNARRLVRNAMPMPFGWGASVVLSGSMEPTLSVNDLVFVRAVNGEDVREGDVVVYQSGASRVIHRVTRILEDGKIVTRGDANNTEDEPIPAEDVKGRMVGKIPVVGAAVRFLQSPIGIILVIAGLILLINLSWKRERKEDDSELDEIKAEIRRLKALEEGKTEEKPEEQAAETEEKPGAPEEEKTEAEE